MVLGLLMPLATHGRWSGSGNQLGGKRKLSGPCCSGDLSCSGLTVSSGLVLISLHNSEEFSRFQTHMTGSYFLVNNLSLQGLLKISHDFLFV